MGKSTKSKGKHSASIAAIERRIAALQGMIVEGGGDAALLRDVLADESRLLAQEQESQRRLGGCGLAKWGPEIAGRIVEHVRDGRWLDDACHLCGVSKSSVHEWLRNGRDDPEGPKGHFYREYKLAGAEHSRKFEIIAWQTAMDGDMKLLGWLLSRRHNRWREPTKIELSGPGGQPIPVEQVTTLSNADLAALATGVLPAAVAGGRDPGAAQEEDFD